MNTAIELQEGTLRCAHFSDLHYCAALLEEADRCFGAAVDSAIAAGVQVAVISGDATDHAQEAHAPAYLALARQLRRLAEHCPVLMLQGTYAHEPPGTLSLFALLGGRHPIHVADRLQQVALTSDGQWRASAGWRHSVLPATARALFTCVPTLNRAAMLVSGDSAASVVPAAPIADLLAGYAPSHQAARAAGVPSLLISHGTVNGCVTEHGLPMAGPDHEFSTGALFDADADAVLLGHIHLHQSWRRRGCLIAYAGSAGRFHYGELGDKGFLLWQVRPGASTAQLVPTPARRTVDLVFDGPPDIAALRAAAADGALAGAHVRVRWQVAEQDHLSVDRQAISAALDGVAALKLEGRVLPLMQARAPGIAALDGLDAQVRAWAEATGACADPLCDCLAALQAGTAERIAAAILAPPAPLALPGLAPQPVLTP